MRMAIAQQAQTVSLLERRNGLEQGRQLLPGVKARLAAQATTLVKKIPLLYPAARFLAKRLRNTITTRLNGGMGNQMFQYAIGRACSIALGTKLKLDISSLDDDPLRIYSLSLWKGVTAPI